VTSNHNKQHKPQEEKMERNKCLGTLRTALLIAVAALAWAGGAAASTYKIIHVFWWARNPMGNLTLDAAGNLYGTTGSGRGSCSGGFACGVVWKLKPNPAGTWTVSILHVFRGADGQHPAAGLVLDKAGNLYGTTDEGGASGLGVVFKLKPNPDGTWTESVLHSFAGGAGGNQPAAGLVFDTAGNLYGTTGTGGAPVDGVVFKLKPNPDGTWTESVLHSFTGGADGRYPAAAPIFDVAGNLYSTTQLGGDFTSCPYGCGVVFKLKPNPDGIWTESVLHSFTGGAEGSEPFAGLTLDGGNLYGTTLGGGSGCGGFGCGVVFKLEPTSSGWSETVLHSFLGFGKFLYAPVIFDRAGNLYGTTSDGNHAFDYGLVFQIKP
jgi:uncharacterized repeat protein (TIGR03803 family)